jgi:uncharacterized protein
MVRKLTHQSSLENLKKEAKRWLKQVRSGEPGARARLLAAHAQCAPEPTLRDVQLALAREHGCAGWPELKAALEDVASESAGREERTNLFLDLACLNYGIQPGNDVWTDYGDLPIRRQRAARMLARDPELGRRNIHTAVVCGDLEAVSGFLAADAAAVHAKGGLQRWEPLLFLAYGRLPIAAASDNALAIARLLLDHGADPNCYWTHRWDQRVMRWHALAGVIGDGEGGPVALPPHPRAEELARFLLDRGASPDAGQAIYNTMLRGDDTRWLELLIEYGLGAQAPGEPQKPAEAHVFQSLLSNAVDRGQLNRARVLLAHGAKPDVFSGTSHYERALRSGNVALAELLLAHGAAKSEFVGKDAFEIACMTVDEPTARRLLQEQPEYLQVAGQLLVHAASARDLVPVARLLLDLGVSPDYEEPNGRWRAAHGTACTDAVHVLELLAERGADLDAIDESDINGRPIAWALHNHMPRVLEFLSRRTRCVFSLTAGGLCEALAALLQREPRLAGAVIEGERGLALGHQRARLGQTPLFVLPDNEDLALEAMELLLARGTDPAHMDHKGKTAAEYAAERGLDEVADALTLAVEQSGQRVALFTAAEEGDRDTLERMLREQPALVHERRRRHEAMFGRRWGVTALHLAAQRGDRALAELLLDRGADPEARASGTDRQGGGTALHWAAHYDQLPVVELLVERGVNVNPDEDAGNREGGVGKSFDLFEHGAIGRYLVEHGARVTLFTAVALGLVERARELLAVDATQVAARQYVGFTPLHLAARQDDAPMVALLLEHGAELNAKDELGRTPIEIALFAGAAKSFAALTALGAAPSVAALARVPNVERAVKLRRFYDACFRDNVTVEAMLQEEPGLANALLPDFWSDNPVDGTALHIAALMGNEVLIELLLRHGADITRKDSRYGGTPAGWAYEYGRRELSERLHAIERAAAC